MARRRRHRRQINRATPPARTANGGDAEFGLTEEEVARRVDAVESLVATCMTDAGTETVDMQNAAFLLDSFPVQCAGLPASLGPGEVVRCTIEDYVTPGFQVARWYGFPPGSGSWGFNYPFEEEG